VGEVRVAAGDALVAGYIIRDMPTVHLAGQIEPAVPLGVAVALDNVSLADPVRAALDELSADGVLDAIRTKWVGAMPKLKLAESSEPSGAVEATVTP
jgi:ABC-type amino acid transport substrate-binding protein